MSVTIGNDDVGLIVGDNNLRLQHFKRCPLLFRPESCRIPWSVRQVNQPITVQGQRAAGLRFGDPTVHMLLNALVLFCLLPDGFSNPDLRLKLAQLLGIDPAQLSPGHLTYQLRRLRLHGFIARNPGTYRYHVTDHGFRIVLFFSRTYAHLLRPGLACLFQDAAPTAMLRRRFDSLDAEIQRSIQHLNFVP